MTDSLIDLVEAWGYLGVGIAMFLENVFPPIPSEVIMGLTGMAVADGKLDFAGAVAAGTAGAVLGNCVWYWIGRVVGYERFRPLIDRFGRWLTLDWAEVEKIVDIFKRFDSAIVFWARFLPQVRTAAGGKPATTAELHGALAGLGVAVLGPDETAGAAHVTVLWPDVHTANGFLHFEHSLIERAYVATMRILNACSA
jgi:membrane protein YqaA with SNARE-associated domain